MELQQCWLQKLVNKNVVLGTDAFKLEFLFKNLQSKLFNIADLGSIPEILKAEFEAKLQAPESIALELTPTHKSQLKELLYQIKK